MTQKISLFVSVTLGFFLSQPAHALFRSCDFFSTGSYDGCDSGSFQPSAGGTYPSLGDAILIDPAAIPTISSPYGLEIIQSAPSASRSRGQTSFALIKGFQRFGTSLATTNPDSFYTNELRPAFRNSVYSATAEDLWFNNPLIAGIQGGVSYSPPLGPLEKLFTTSVGASLRYQRETHKFDPVYGITLGSEFLYFGASRVSEHRSALLPVVNQTTLTGGLRMSKFQIEYSHLAVSAGNYTHPTRIVTASLAWRSWSFTAARKQFIDGLEGQITRYMASAQYQFSKKMAIGYVYGLFPGTSSLGTQLFL